MGTIYDECKDEIQKVLESCEGIPVAEAMAKVRVEAARAIERVCEEHGVTDRLRALKPGEIITVSQNALDLSIIEVQLSDRLKNF